MTEHAMIRAVHPGAGPGARRAVQAVAMDRLDGRRRSAANRRYERPQHARRGRRSRQGVRAPRGRGRTHRSRRRTPLTEPLPPGAPPPVAFAPPPIPARLRESEPGRVRARPDARAGTLRPPIPPFDGSHAGPSAFEETAHARPPTPGLRHIPLGRLELSPDNARRTPANDASLAELKASIAAHGLLENLIVRPPGRRRRGPPRGDRRRAPARRDAGAGQGRRPGPRLPGALPRLQRRRPVARAVARREHGSRRNAPRPTRWRPSAASPTTARPPPRSPPASASGSARSSSACAWAARRRSCWTRCAPARSIWRR